MEKFDRNKFKEFAINSKLIEKEQCSLIHNEIVAHGIYTHITWKSSFRAISNSELSEKYTLIGSLRDDKIKNLSYTEFNDQKGEYWHPNSKIATNFYPYHACDVYRCNECNKLFLVYVETAGHGSEQRIRLVKPELIEEEPSNCVLEILPNKIPLFLKLIAFEGNFEIYLLENKNIERIKTDYDIEEIFVKTVWENSYLIVAKRDKLYEIIDRLQKL